STSSRGAEVRRRCASPASETRSRGRPLVMVPQVPAADAPGVADHALIALMALLPLAEAWWYWPRIVRALADRVPGARRRAYRNLIVLEWTFAAAVVALWVLPHRTWAALHVAEGRPAPTALGG